MEIKEIKEESKVDSKVEKSDRKKFDPKLSKFSTKGKKKFPGNTKDRSTKRSYYPHFEPGNDFAFWNEYPDLMSIASKYPWMHIAGTTLRSRLADIKLGNIVVQSFQPIPGFQRASTSPLNLMFRQMYLDMHRRYRGIGAYQASDIAITVLCIESVQQMIIEAERIYGVLNRIPVKARMLPVGVLTAIGYNTDFIMNVSQNLADFRYGINRIIENAKRLPLPTGMNFGKMHTALNAFLYTDSDDERASILAFKCTHFFKYVTTDSDYAINAAGTAVLEEFDRSAMETYTDLLSKIESYLEILLRDSDILRITSDFIACYGEDNVQVLSPVPEDYVVTPVYSQSILLKWHNSEHLAVEVCSFGVPRASGLLDESDNSILNERGEVCFKVYQMDDVVYSCPLTCFAATDLGQTYELEDISGNSPAHGLGSRVGSVLNSRGLYGSDHFVDTWESEPSEETRCEALLWKPDNVRGVMNADGDPQYYAWCITNVSTEVLTDLRIYAFADGVIAEMYAIPGGPQTISTLANTADKAKAICNLAKFDWHPLIRTYTDAIDVQYRHEVILNNLFGDVDNVSEVASETIAKVIDAALLSAYKVNIAVKGN